MQLYSIATEPRDVRSQLGKTDEARQLKEMLMLDLGPQAGSREFKSIIDLHKKHEPSTVLDAIRRSVAAKEPRMPYVRKQLMQILDEISPPINHCTAGRSAIEMNCNGDYGRCVWTVGRKRFMGNIFEDGGFNLLNLDTDSACDMNCKRRMCYARNTIRTETKEQLDQQIAEKGIRGDYRKSRDNRKSDIFIRWKITETCNYTCSYCTAWKTVNKKIPEMSLDQVMKAAEIICDRYDRISLRLTGGEPAVKRNYVELMEYFHSRLDKFVEIEIRTNFSYPEKQKSVFALDWQDKLHYHIGCHVYDKNFRPWDFVDILSKPTNVDYIVKFVSTAANKKYVDAYYDYFVKHGINEEFIRIVHDIRDSAEDNSAVPPSIVKMSERGELPADFFRKDSDSEKLAPAA